MSADVRRRRKRENQAESHNSRRSRGRAGFILLAILVAGLALRGAYLWEIVDAPDFSAPLADALFHDYWARGIATGDWTPPEGTPNPEIDSTPYMRPPGYPYFLALIYFVTGPSYLGARVAQMGLGLASAVLGFLLGKRLFGPGVGLTLAGFMSVYWAFIYFEGELQAPALLVFLGLSLIYAICYWHARPTLLRAAGVGLLLGVFAVVRPNVLLFVPVVLAWTWWVARRRAQRRLFPVSTSGYLLGVVLAVAPVTIRNYVVAGDVVLISTNGAINLYIGNNERSDGISSKFPGVEELTGHSMWGWFSYPDMVRNVGRQVGRPMTYSEVSSYFVRKSIDYIRQNPLRTLRLMGRRALLFWGPGEISNNKVIHYEREHSQALRFIPGFPLVLSLFIVGTLLLILDLRKTGRGAEASPERTGRIEMSVLILLFIGTYFCSFLAFLVAARFRVPIIPFLALFGAYGLYRVGGFIAAGDLVRSGGWIAGGGVLYLLAGIPIVPYEPDLAWWHTDRGVAFVRQGQLDKGVEEFHAALQVKPGYPDAHLNLAGALLAQGKTDEAIQNFRKAIESRPSNAAARHRLGVLLARQNRLDEAVEEYRAALRVTPDDAGTWYDLGLALGRKGAVSEAMDAYHKAIAASPDMKQARVNLGVLLKAQGRIDAAVAEFRRALGTDPRMFEAHYNLAAALTAQGKLEEAYRELTRALDIQPEHPAVLRALERLQAMRGESKQPPTR